MNREHGETGCTPGRYTHMIGHPTCRPTIELHGGKQGMFALTAWKDFDGPGVDNFYHQVQNLNIRIVGGNPGDPGPRGPGSAIGTIGIHWKCVK